MKSFRVERALKKIGHDIKAARRRRRLTMQNMAERLGITRMTLAKLEAGSPAVSMGSYAMAFYVLGKLEALEDVLDRRHDSLGLDLLEQKLSKRGRS